MRWLKHRGRFIGDLALYVVGTGRWWIGLVIPAFALVTTLVVVAKVTVPTLVYAFF